MLRYWVIFLLFLTTGFVWAQDLGPQTASLFERIKKQPLVGLEIILAGPTYQSAGSQYGHAMIRLVSDRKNPYNDLVLNFMADGSGADEAELKQASGSRLNRLYQVTKGLAKIYARGLTGHYQMGLEVTTFHEALNNYAGFQGRSMQRLIVPTSAEQRQRFQKLLIDFIEGRIKTDYYFLSVNCATFIVKLLQLSGLDYFPLTVNSPLEIEAAMNRFFWAPLPAVEMLNVPLIVRQIVKNLPTGLDITSEDSLVTMLNPLSKLDLMRIYLLHSQKLNDKTRDAIAARIRHLPGNTTLEEIYGSQVFDFSVYQLNDSSYAPVLQAEFADRKKVHCQKLKSALLYRKAFPLPESNQKLFQVFKNTYLEFCDPAAAFF